MFLDNALEFIRNADWNEWQRLMSEMRQTQKARDLEAADNLSPGDTVVYYAPNLEDSRLCHVISIVRGRVLLTVGSSRAKTGFRQYSVPASMVRQYKEWHKEWKEELGEL